MRSQKSVSALLSILVMITLLMNCHFIHADNLRALIDLKRKPDISRIVSVAPLLVEKYLLEGKLADGEAALLYELKEHKSDDQLRFGLGVLQVLRAVEQLAQDLYRYGVRSIARELNVPFLRLPVPSNPKPEALSYGKTRKVAETLVNNLAKAETTLASINDVNVKLPLHFSMIRLDLNGDGQADEDESLWKLYASLTSNTKIHIKDAQQFSIRFDRGDVHWLRAYCHLLMAMCELYLAHDSKETFECTAHIFFTKVESPFGFLNTGKHVRSTHADHTDILDLIALIHLVRWDVVEPQRMAAALHHLEGMVNQSRTTWKYVMAETDDDREWIPNPKQTGVIPNVRVTEEMVCAWTELMNQIEQILAGKLLIAFWRGDDGRGINLRKVFMEPRRLDLVLWVQGSAAAPYLQKGDITKIEIWRRLDSAFGRQFPGFAIWFN